MKTIFIHPEPLAVRIATNPIRWMFKALLFGGFLGLVAASIAHYAWVNTVYRQQIEQEYAKKLVYHTYEQSKCVAKRKMTPSCADWF